MEGAELDAVADEGPGAIDAIGSGADWWAFWRAEDARRRARAPWHASPSADSSAA